MFDNNNQEVDHNSSKFNYFVGALAGSSNILRRRVWQKYVETMPGIILQYNHAYIHNVTSINCI